MTLHFSKYQGTGNDFIMIDNMDRLFDKLAIELIQELCDRKFGIGADGLIILEPDDQGMDFYMNYYNADGSQSFCGNGSRCVVAFAKQRGVIIGNKTTYKAIDGVHTSVINNDETVSTKMGSVDKSKIEKEEYYFIDTGSPHYIVYVDDVDGTDLISEAKKVRYNDRFKQEGTNYNIVHSEGDKIYVRTYERGVEDETLSCGTGVTACALSAFYELGANKEVEIITKGGKLSVRFVSKDTVFDDIWLTGPAKKVFEGEIDVQI